jgi:hypothetical protein
MASVSFVGPLALALVACVVASAACAPAGEAVGQSEGAATADATELLPDSCDVCARNVAAGEAREFEVQVARGSIARLELSRLVRHPEVAYGVAIDGAAVTVPLPSPDGRVVLTGTIALGNSTSEGVSHRVLIDNSAGQEPVVLTDRVQPPSESLFCFGSSAEPCFAGTNRGTCAADPTFTAIGGVGVCKRSP